jgi:uncharacterized repeat protein (TIGR01451 family)
MLVVAISSTVVLIGAVPASAAAITSSGPLTRVEISPDLNCAVDHAGDESPEFFGDTACATLLASGGTLYGPAIIPAGDNAGPRTAYTAVSQTPVTGSGTSADPYQVITVVDLGTSGLRISQRDTYVVGEESYRTDVTVQNTGAEQASAILYRAGDCFLQNSDSGFGSADPETGAVSCVAGMDDGSGGFVPGTRIEQWFPLSAGSHYDEDFFDNVWAAVGSQQTFADTCAQCANYVDNGAGLSWGFTVPAGGAVTRSNLTVFSPLGVQPLSTTKSADADTADPGGSDGYTISIHNPNDTSASLGTITDTLPAGFAYVAGSTTGATTADPSIEGQDLTWSGPISVPASGDASIHFGVTVSTTPGTYVNNAGGSADGYTVAPTGDTAPVTVNGASTGVPGAPTDATAFPGDRSAVVTWTPPEDSGGSEIDSYLVTCTNTANGDDVSTASVDGLSTMAEVGGLTNGETYACVVQAHNDSGFGPASEPTAPFTPTDTQEAVVIDSSAGGTIILEPTEHFEGTSGKLLIPPQPGPATDVIVTASLFGHPGDVDETCGGNECVGQGIEWGVSDPGIVTKMKVVFKEAPFLVGGAPASTAKAYKDGLLLPDCRHGSVDPSVTGPCVRRRQDTKPGGWRIIILATGEDPKGRI